MIVKVHNKKDSSEFVLYDMHFVHEKEEGLVDAEISLGGVIFEKPYSNSDIEIRVGEIVPDIFPNEEITQIIIE